MSADEFTLGDLDDNDPDDNFSLVIPVEEPKTDDTADRMRQLEFDNAALRAQQNTRFEHQYVAPAPVYQQPVQHRSKQEIDSDVAAALVNNPADFLARNNAAVIAATQEDMNKRFRPVQIATVKNQIHSYALENIKDPIVRKEFNKIVGSYSEDQIANLDVLKLDESLKIVHKYAKAEALENGHIPDDYAGNAPNYGGSRRGGSGAPSGHKRMDDLNAVEKDYAKIQRSLGYSDKEIADDIKVLRKNPNRNITVSHREG